MKLLESIGATEWINGLKVVTCAHSRCNRWITQRYLDVRRVGVTFGDQWYCSYGCFQPAAEEQIVKLRSDAPAGPISRTSRMPLGLMLVNRGLLTTDQYRYAQEAQRTSGEEMGDVLIQLGLLTERQVTAVRASQWSCPVFSQSSSLFSADAQIPPALMRLSSMAPLHFVSGNRKLLVGFVYGVEYGPLYAVEQMLDCTAQACFITSSEFQLRLMQRNEQEHPEELTFEGKNNPAEITRVLCDYGRLVNADEVILRRCRDFLWARLKSRAKSTDLLFRVS